MIFQSVVIRADFLCFFIFCFTFWTFCPYIRCKTKDEIIADGLNDTMQNFQNQCVFHEKIGGKL